MKIVLGLSLLLNLVLGFFLLKKEEKPPMERLIIETHARPEKIEVKETRGHTVEAIKPVSPTVVPKKEKEAPKPNPPEFYSFENDEFQDAGERMESERKEFLTEKLGLPEEKLLQHQKLRENFYKETSALWNKSSMGELSFKDKRRMVDLEEKLHRDLEGLYGKKNWERYQKFREDYNTRGFKNQQETNQPFLFMGI